MSLHFQKPSRRTSSRSSARTRYVPDTLNKHEQTRFDVAKKKQFLEVTQHHRDKILTTWKEWCKKNKLPCIVVIHTPHESTVTRNGTLEKKGLSRKEAKQLAMAFLSS